VTPLHFAASGGYLSVVEYLVNHKADIYSMDEDMLTPLHYSAINDHLSIFEFLIKQISGFHEGNIFESYLHWASENGLLSFVECLINHGADMNAKTDNEGL